MNSFHLVLLRFLPSRPEYVATLNIGEFKPNHIERIIHQNERKALSPSEARTADLRLTLHQLCTISRLFGSEYTSPEQKKIQGVVTRWVTDYPPLLAIPLDRLLRSVNLRYFINMERFIDLIMCVDCKTFMEICICVQTQRSVGANRDTELYIETR